MKVFEGAPPIDLREEREKRISGKRTGTVLVVDDIRDYTDEISRALRRDGHEVYTADDGRQAIVLGTSVRPDVLLTDWLLRDHIHGLDVAQAITIALPSIQAIVMTGFASHDLASDADAVGVIDFLEKPFPLERARTAVQRALQAELPQRSCFDIGFVEIDADGSVGYANPPAEQFLAELTGKDEMPTVLPSTLLAELSEGAATWTHIAAHVTEPGWYVRAREELDPEFGTAFVMLREQHYPMCHKPIVHRLLGLPDPDVSLPQIEGHILVVDDLRSIRRFTVEMLKACQCVCHAAQDRAEATRLFVHDTQIRHVILDYDVVAAEPSDLVERMLSVRQGVQVIGTSYDSRRSDFLRFGVTEFLPKPWDMNELLQLLSRGATEAKKVVGLR